MVDFYAFSYCSKLNQPLTCSQHWHLNQNAVISEREPSSRIYHVLRISNQYCTWLNFQVLKSHPSTTRNSKLKVRRRYVSATESSYAPPPTQKKCKHHRHRNTDANQLLSGRPGALAHDKNARLARMLQHD